MCRFAAYVGPSISLDRFLLQPAHSLARQAFAPREMQTAVANADGFGIAWYDDRDGAARYRQTVPVWADHNLPDLALSLRRPLWLAYVRSATDPFVTGLHNTQPFVDKELTFIHNGFIQPFPGRVRGLIRQWLHPEVEIGIHGATDSEYLFACLRQLLHEHEDISLEDALGRLCGQLEHWLEDETLLLNLAISDGRRVYALRHAIGAECPSLYYTTDDESFPDAQIVASEALTDADYWHPVPPGHMLVLDPDEPAQLTAL